MANFKPVVFVHFYAAANMCHGTLSARGQTQTPEAQDRPGSWPPSDRVSLASVTPPTQCNVSECRGTSAERGRRVTASVPQRDTCLNATCGMGTLR